MCKKILSSLLTICLLVSLLPSFGTLALAAGCITVGSSGDYSTITDALTHVENGGTVQLLENISESVSISVNSGIIITIDGSGYTVTAPDQTDKNSIAFAFAGSGTIILKNITLQGGTVTSNHYSIGLETISGSVNILSGGNVSAIGGTSEYMSQGVNCKGSGTVDIDVAIGGPANSTIDQTGSVGIYNNGTGTVNVYSATGGSSNKGSVGIVNNSTGTVNVTYAAAGNGDTYGDGVDNTGGGCVNVYQATSATGTTTESFAIYNESGTVNAKTASSIWGTVNTNVTTLMLNKGSGVSCVLDSITVAISGDTTIGTLPSMSMNGQYSGKWYTDIALTTLFSGTAVPGGTLNLYSAFYQLYSISGRITDNEGAGLAATLQLLDRFGNDVVSILTADSDGTYCIQNVPAGTGYTIKVSMPGYVAGIISAFDLTVSITGKDLILVTYAAQLTSGGMTTQYDTIQNALNAAGNGDTVTVLRNSTESLACTVINGITITVDGGGHTVTAPDTSNAASIAMALTGSGTIILKNITLQGGNVAGNYMSCGLSGLSAPDLTVLSDGAVTAKGGTTDYYSIGVCNMGIGAVNIDTAIGGAGNKSYGIYNSSNGTVNVNTAAGGSGSSGSYGIQNSSGTVNAVSAIGNNYGVYNHASSYINVTNAQGGTYDIANNGTVNAANVTSIGNGAGAITNYGSDVTVLTLNKGTGAACVLDSIQIAASGDTMVGTLPGVIKNGIIGTWYITSEKTTELSDSTVPSTTTALYSTFYTVLDTTAPTVAAVTPSGTNAATIGNVLITFSEDMSAITGTVSLTSADGTVILDPSGGSWTNIKTYTIPYFGLLSGTAYTVDISGFQDTAGNAMTNDSTHGFTTWASFTVTTGDGAYSFDSSGNLTVTSSGSYRIEGPGTTVMHTIKVSDGITANITLNNVNIDVSKIGGCAFELLGTSHANLTLDGNNTFKSGNDCAGIQVPENAALTITGGNLDSLTATGGTSGAGIGGGWKINGGTVTISGGCVTASSITTGAGIGGGFNGNGGTVTISGGTVNAFSISTGAGIGGGLGGNGGDVTISSGTITANSDYGAGIGGGYDPQNGGSGGTVNISGGTIMTHGARGAGIGGGGGWNGNGGNGSTVIITGGTLTTSSAWGAGIGGGSSIAGSYGGSGGTVYISGGSIKATGDNGSENIGKALHGINSGTLQNNSIDQTSIYLTTISLDGLSVKTAVASLTTSLYGSAYCFDINDMYTDANGKLYLYLPENTETTVVYTTANNYAGSVTTTVDPSTSFGTLPLDNPTILNVTPYGTNAELNGNIVITFSEEMDTSKGSVSLDSGNTYLTGGSWSADARIYTIAYSGLSYNTEYTVMISDFMDMAGNIIIADNTHRFTTKARTGSGAFQPRITLTTSDGITTITVTIDALPDVEGTLNASLTADLISQMLNKAGNTDNIVLKAAIQGLGSASGLTFSISSAAQAAMTDGNIAIFTIMTPFGTLSFNAETLAQITGQAGGDIKITVSTIDSSSLSDNAKALIGNRPVYDFSISSSSKGISDFGSGMVVVNLPYTPTNGEDIDNIIICFISDNGEPITVPNCVFDSAAGMITFSTTHFSIYAVAYNDISFTDVTGWYKDYVDFTAARGIMNGIGDRIFYPGGSMTRAMFVTVLYRLSGEKESNTNFFSDVSSGIWYENAASWAAENDIVRGVGDGRFGPDLSITREQLAVMLYRYAQYKGYDVTIGEDTNILLYNDAFKVSNYAYPALQWACSTGILNGDASGNLNPKNSATRAEAAAMLQRFIKKITYR